MMSRRRFLPLLWSLCVLAILVPTLPAAAQDLNALRASGAMGERFDGYAEARDAGVRDQVKTINARRQQIYSQRAAEQGVSAAQVGRIYAKEIMANAPAGTFFLGEDGNWIQK